jgi:short-subunit dehydrogenase
MGTIVRLLHHRVDRHDRLMDRVQSVWCHAVMTSHTDNRSHNTNAVRTSPRPKALITGASSGIGAIYADRLARRGYDLILVARDRGRLRHVGKRITTETGQSVDIVAADLTDAGDLRRVEELLRTDASIDLLVTNAGSAMTGDLASISPDILMDAGDVVDAALAGLDRGEVVTIPSLEHVADWEAFEAARAKLLPQLSKHAPATRYRIRVVGAAV